MTAMTSKMRYSFAEAMRRLLFIADPSVVHSVNCHKSQNDKRVVINVSGIKFETWRTNLDQHPTTLLGSCEIDYFFDERNNEYFFDRDPHLFRYILNYYSTGELHFPKYECHVAFENELKFYRIVPDMIQDCCFEEYQDYKDAEKETLYPERHSHNAKEKDTDTEKPQRTFRENLWQMFEDPEKSGMPQVAPAFNYIIGFFVMISILANIIETVPVQETDGSKISSTPMGDKYNLIFTCLDTACVAIFTVEYVLRVYAAPSRARFVSSGMSIIDLIAILPFYIGLCLADTGNVNAIFVTLRVFRVFRVLKFSRDSTGLRLLGYTIRNCMKELGFLVFSMLIAVIIFSTFMFYIEKGVENTKYTSIPATFWYTIVTMTTLGYGDMVPKTWLGKTLTGICSLSGVLLITLPVTVIVTNFNHVIQKAEREKKLETMDKHIFNKGKLYNAPLLPTAPHV
ncbi:KCND3 [Branchiostoma lanceolatum]|uniref:A-type voltage-gated potassium channel KCND1 n=1 Tax=Branchiostoma lanceolatum TaxID=7740 RepID=A0A8K0ACT5_BRALA|nr:KCND3 [Branchiostoma lanceolatum]